MEERYDPMEWKYDRMEWKYDRMEERYDPMEHGYDPMECKLRLDCIFVQNAPPYNCPADNCAQNEDIQLWTTSCWRECRIGNETVSKFILFFSGREDCKEH